jgi:hypothetical protein
MYKSLHIVTIIYRFVLYLYFLKAGAAPDGAHQSYACESCVGMELHRATYVPP